jgi:leucine-rich repeat protein SHOC2
MKIPHTLLVFSIFITINIKSQIVNYNYKDSTFTNFNSAIANPKNVYKLQLSNQRLNTDSLDLSVFTNLQILTLTSDSLYNLPIGLEKLEFLKVLDISANNFTLLPEKIAQIPNLEELYLNQEKHLDLDQSFKVINKITHLKRLHLDSIPNFKLPKNLTINNNIEYLSLRYDGLENIPNQLKKFKHLKTLDLEGNSIQSIDRNILRNKEIESLIISVSPEFKFKKSFLVLAKEPNLNSLTISNSNFDFFNQDFSILSNLNSLSLHNDHLKTFPPSILKLKKLKDLDISGNDFNTLPTTILSLNKLERINLTGDNFLNYSQTAELIRQLPSLQTVLVQDYNFILNTESYLKLKDNSNYIELFPTGKKNSPVHIFKSLKPASQPLLNPTFNNFNAEGFGIRLGF